MNKRMKFSAFLVVLGLTVLMLYGCGEGEKPAKQEKQVEQEEKNEQKEDPDKTEEVQNVQDTEKDMETSSGDSQQTRNVRVYYVDKQSGQVTGKNVEIRNENDIWTALQENAILTPDCHLLSMTLNEAENKIDLDFDSATGERIRSMGTTGEIQIIGCIINTYLEAYDCDGIKLTEEGNPLQTSHGATYEGYSGVMSF